MRVLTASAARLRLKDREQSRKMRLLRQGWQSDAWNYYDSVGELKYAVNYLANCFARMRLYPAAYPVGGEDDDPVPLADIEGVPPEVLAVCKEAMRDLGNGRMAIAALLHSFSTNLSTAGECFLLGEEEPGGADKWTIRSTEEVVVQEEKYKLRELPTDPQGATGYIELPEESTVISRIWLPHPKFRELATSQVRAIMDDLESLQILRRMIRVEGRSRLAMRGLLALPDEMEIKTAEDDNADTEGADFLSELNEAMMEGLAEEGTAAAAVPITIQGPAEHLDKIRLIEFSTMLAEKLGQTREELVQIIATGLDLPAEVITGKADLNHWSAWQVDDDVFRAHVEPHVIQGCDSLTAAYLRPYMEGKGIDPEWVHRIIFWYDPAELVVHPDRSKDAFELFKEMAISAEALRRETGFSDTDAPSVEEIQTRQFQHIRNFPLNLMMAWAHMLDPTLTAPPITESGTVPGVKPSGVDMPPSAPSNGAGPAQPPAGTVGGPQTPAQAPASPGPPAEPSPTSVTASGKPANGARLSRRLASIDRDLRARLQTAANAAMRRKLEQAGARLRSALVNHPNETTRETIKQNRNDRLTAHVGKEAVVAAGQDPAALFNSDWSGLREQFLSWTKAAQEQALSTALQLGELDVKDLAAIEARAALTGDADKAWGLLEGALDHLGHALMFGPDPNLGPTEWADLNPDTLVPLGTIRGALAIAGGTDPRMVEDLGVIPGSEKTIPLGVPVGQIGTGATISELLEGTGAQQEQYQWEHGPALKPFEPHLDLDGVQFNSFDDAALSNDSDFPGNDFFFPGDHGGCGCDAIPMWVSPSEVEGEVEARSE
jgi:hypothetical protein